VPGEDRVNPTDSRGIARQRLFGIAKRTIRALGFEKQAKRIYSRLRGKQTPSLTAAPPKVMAESTTVPVRVEHVRDPRRPTILICARVGDSLFRPGQARTIWALHTAQGAYGNGLHPLLLGRSNTLPYRVWEKEGYRAYDEALKMMYGLEAPIEYTMPTPLTGRPPNADRDGSWELSSEFLMGVLDNAQFAHVRDPRLAPLLAKRAIPFAYEDHNEDYHLAASRAHLSALNHSACRVVVAITPAVADRLRARGVRADKIVCEESGVTVRGLQRESSEVVAWRNFLLNDGRYEASVYYGGGLQPERGVGQLLDAAALLPGAIFVIAGGRLEDVKSLSASRARRGLRNVKITGFLPQRIAAAMAQASDVAVYTRSALDDRSAITSPLKYFEYLACGTPVVAFGIPAIVANLPPEGAVTLFEEPHGQALAGAITQSLGNFPWKIDGYANNVKAALPFDWTNREARIIAHLGIGQKDP
jgi:glycosyltransferase involved in cell wall biosynthesis